MGLGVEKKIGINDIVFLESPDQFIRGVVEILAALHDVLRFEMMIEKPHEAWRTIRQRLLDFSNCCEIVQAIPACNLDDGCGTERAFEMQMQFCFRHASEKCTHTFSRIAGAPILFGARCNQKTENCTGCEQRYGIACT